MEIHELEKEIRKHNSLYEKGKPIIPDYEYDKLINYLKYLSPNSEVLTEVGAPVTYGRKVKHEIVMGSLDKIQCELNENGSPVDGHGSYELQKWVEKINKVVCFSMKVDGLAGELVYENGHLIEASSRGNGTIGMSILDNVLHIESIPTEISCKEKLVIRGEFYIPKSAFQELLCHEKFKDKIINERNICSGLIMSKNVKGISSKGIRFIVYRAWINNEEMIDLPSSFNKINNIHGKHFDKKAKLYHIEQLMCDNPLYVPEIVKSLSEEREKLDFRTDGLVISVMNTEERHSFGHHGNNPKGAVAFKFQTEKALSTILDIEWTTSKYGTINPVAKITPVTLCETEVSSPTLHNIDWIECREISIGDDIVVEKSGDIIPHIVKVIPKKATGNINYPYYCPTCGKTTTRNGPEILCTNPHCKAIVSGIISNYLKLIDIVEPGKVMIENMVEAGLISKIEDIYSLKQEDLIRLPRCSDMLAKRYITNINENKEILLSTFLNALPIKNVGLSTWKNVCNVYLTLDEVMSANWDELVTIPGIGKEIASDIVNGFFQYNKTIQELSKHVNIIQDVKKEGILKGLMFCFTGKMSRKRKDYEDIVNKNGGSVSGVNKNLNFLVAGDGSGKKIEIARKMGITILSEDDFIVMLRE